MENLYVFIQEDGPFEQQGVILGEMHGPQGRVPLPLIGADRERAEMMRPLAQVAADQSGRQVKLVRYHEREVIAVIEPRGRDRNGH